MAGAVDLSALKQRATTAGEGGAPEHVRPTVWRSPRPTSKPRCWSWSSQVPVVVLLVVAAQRGERRTRRRPRQSGSSRRRQGSHGTVKVDTVPRRGADVRRAGRPDRGGFGRGPTAVEFPGRAAARAVALLGRLAAERRTGKLSGGKPMARNSNRSTRSWRRRAHLDAGDFDAAPRRIRRSRRPTRTTPKPRARCVRSHSCSGPRRNDLDAVAVADVRLPTSTRRSPQRMLEIQQNRCGGVHRLIALIKRTAGDDAPRSAPG